MTIIVIDWLKVLWALIAVGVLTGGGYALAWRRYL